MFLLFINIFLIKNILEKYEPKCENLKRKKKVEELLESQKDLLRSLLLAKKYNKRFKLKILVV